MPPLPAPPVERRHFVHAAAASAARGVPPPPPPPPPRHMLPSVHAAAAITPDHSLIRTSRPNSQPHAPPHARPQTTYPHAQASAAIVAAHAVAIITPLPPLVSALDCTTRRPFAPPALPAAPSPTPPSTPPPSSLPPQSAPLRLQPTPPPPSQPPLRGPARRKPPRTGRGVYASKRQAGSAKSREAGDEAAAWPARCRCRAMCNICATLQRCIPPRCASTTNLRVRAWSAAVRAASRVLAAARRQLSGRIAAGLPGGGRGGGRWKPASRFSCCRPVFFSGSPCDEGGVKEEFG
jgi:hypothetical protein